MNIILLSGGSGRRLWPLSNDIRSKQFIKLFKDENGEYESMIQRVYRQITTVDPDAKVTIATSKSQASAIHNQLGDKASICVEPCRRDTFPAILLAAAYLHDELGVG
ncbi:sugar phosphate nucleotidyltransferase, partial [Enterococcus faecium]